MKWRINPVNIGKQECEKILISYATELNNNELLLLHGASLYNKE